FRTHRAAVPVMTAPRRALCPSVYSFFVTKARYSACKRRAHAGGDDTFLRIEERRRERDPGVSTIRNARLVPSPSLTTKRCLLRRRDTNSFANSCLVSIVSPFTVRYRRELKNCKFLIFTVTAIIKVTLKYVVKQIIL
ncbi:hypothetical protein ALC57_04321, partial [Trachymyrmex cornetzi]